MTQSSRSLFRVSRDSSRIVIDKRGQEKRIQNPGNSRVRRNLIVPTRAGSAARFETEEEIDWTSSRRAFGRILNFPDRSFSRREISTRRDKNHGSRNIGFESSRAKGRQSFDVSGGYQEAGRVLVSGPANWPIVGNRLDNRRKFRIQSTRGTSTAGSTAPKCTRNYSKQP